MEIDDLFNDVESKFNIAGSLPLIASFSGTMRILAGQVQFVAGAILAVIGVVQKNKGERGGQELSDLGYKHLVHGLANVGRGSVEAFLGSFFFGLGSLLLLSSQTLSGRGFDPILNYKEGDPISSINGMVQGAQTRFGQ